MELNLPAGIYAQKYVVAVSGGVDSVVLLHLLAQKTTANDSTLSLIVAHYDHGIRPDSAEDRELVQALAKQYGLAFAYEEGKLGPRASEAQAREARYAFLHKIRREDGATAIVMAHHQDDVLETLVLNLLRGTSHRGLHSLKSTDTVKRPLLAVPKKELLRYAKREGLRWREDSTNADTKYLRNYVRHKVLPRFADADREVLVGVNQKAAEIGRELQSEIDEYLAGQPAQGLDRYQFLLLPHMVAREIMAAWLKNYAHVELSRQLLERLVVAAKTARAGSKVNVNGQHWLYISHALLALQPPER